MKIESTDNKKFKLWKSLLHSKGIREHQMALVSGTKVIQELPSDRLLDTLHFEPGSDVHLSKALYNELDLFNTRHPLAVVKIDAPLEFDWNTSVDCVVLPTGDPLNLGSIIRTAVAMGIEDIVLTPSSCHPFLPKVTRSASGMNLKVRFHKTTDIPANKTIILDLDGMPIERFEWPKPTRFYLGEEGPGVSQNLIGERVTVSISDQCESLNVAAAFAMAAFCWKSKN